MEFVSPNPFTSFIFYVFLSCAVIVIAYTCNFYYLAFLSGRRKEIQEDTVSIGEPTITIQLPIYNEKYVAKRLINSVCELDYPKQKLFLWFWMILMITRPSKGPELVQD
ncbi:MAG: hypothetical protein CM1200mP23_0240 [Nitrososphaerota archaeon]|nr:MAG: hypothetical protein CM1200mP23_0240 [Nitrososphaerota archaeon]